MQRSLTTTVRENPQTRQKTVTAACPTAGNQRHNTSSCGRCRRCCCSAALSLCRSATLLLCCSAALLQQLMLPPSLLLLFLLLLLLCRCSSHCPLFCVSLLYFFPRDPKTISGDGVPETTILERSFFTGRWETLAKQVRFTRCQNLQTRLVIPWQT